MTYDAAGLSQSDTLVQLDARRRCSLAKVGKPEHSLYAVEEMDDGTMVFRPCAVVKVTTCAVVKVTS